MADFELNTQAKILRVLEEGEFRRVGEQKCIPVDTRILSATNRDLGRMMIEGRFREDLYYRLNTMTIHVPPCGSGGATSSFWPSISWGRFAGNTKGMRNSAGQRWTFFSPTPGRETQENCASVVSYALNMTDSDVIDPTDLPHYLLISEGRAELNRRIPPAGVEPESFRPRFCLQKCNGRLRKGPDRGDPQKIPEQDQGHGSSWTEPALLLPEAQKTRAIVTARKPACLINVTPLPSITKSIHLNEQVPRRPRQAKTD